MALHAVLNLGPAFLTVGLYHLLVRWLVARLGVVDDRSPLQRLDAARRSLGLIAFLIFASGEELDHMQVHSGSSLGYSGSGNYFWAAGIGGWGVQAWRLSRGSTDQSHD